MRGLPIIAIVTVTIALAGCEQDLDLGSRDRIDADPGTQDPDAATLPCGPTLTVEDITATGTASGSISGPAPNELTTDTCASSGGEFVYSYTVTGGPVTLVISTDFTATTLDTTLYVRTDCLDSATELGCDDDGGTMTSTTSLLTLTGVSDGTYYIVVDSFAPIATGFFLLTVSAM